ncbi:MAG: undecaprenyl/decaprenyl-phosphate alpha-N-acetylglucosaminyl 1-phosphate transferase [Candidatus Pacebacteria bacterium]|nr:undecaprenyl/decaprenyl-phosphate alpha-N-acetylglucosaminyl 1-phosphate transferase [Candidatus Paceibacterota bacterium]
MADLPFLKMLILRPFLSAFLISFALTPPTIWLAKKTKLVTDVKKRKHPAHTHQGVIPRAGGLPVFLSILGTTLFFLPFDQHLSAIITGAALLVIVGLLDDRFDLNPYLRMIICLLAACLVVASGIGIAFINNPLSRGIIRLDQPQISFFLWGKERHFWLIADTLAIIWIVWMTNIVNWVKGFDGQLPGIVTIAALTIALLSLKFSADITQWPVTILASITAGAYLGFLPFNFYPQKIMPGYGGGSLAGFILAVLAILTTTKVGTAIVVLGIPIIDAFYTIIRRLIAGHSPVWGDRGHLHHHLLDLGWSKRKTAFFYWGTTAVLGILALCLNSRQKFYTISMLAILIGGLLLWLRFLSTWSKPPGRDNH